MDSRAVYRIPGNLRETIVDLTIGYLLEKPRPATLIDYSIKFFRKLKGEPEPEERGSGSSAVANDGTTTTTSESQGQPSSPPSQMKKEPASGGGDAGGKLVLEETAATWIFHLAARYVLEEPEDIAEWGLQYCLNEKDRWAYA